MKAEATIESMATTTATQLGAGPVHQNPTPQRPAPTGQSVGRMQREAVAHPGQSHRGPVPIRVTAGTATAA